MNIESFILSIVVLIYAFCVLRWNQRLLNDKIKSDLRLRIIAHEAVSLIEDIKADSGDGSYYISSPNYLVSRLQNIYDAADDKPLAAPITPSAAEPEPTIGEGD